MVKSGALCGPLFKKGDDYKMRINVYDHAGNFAGWFDCTKSEKFSITIEWKPHKLHRTSSGRWILERLPDEFAPKTYRDNDIEFQKRNRFEFITDDEAHRFLKDNKFFEKAEEYFGEKKLGRPEIGPAILVRIPEAAIARLDQIAADLGISRAELIRNIIENKLFEEEINAAAD